MPQPLRPEPGERVLDPDGAAQPLDVLRRVRPLDSVPATEASGVRSSSPRPRLLVRRGRARRTPGTCTRQPPPWARAQLSWMRSDAISDPRSAQMAGNPVKIDHVGSHYAHSRIQVNPEARTTNARRMGSMEPLYSPEGVEERWQRTWEEEGLYDARTGSEPRELGLRVPASERHRRPAPGARACSSRSATRSSRLKRMQGLNVLFQCGYDHAGIATQTAVEKHLAREGTSRQELGREAFEARVWAWLHEYGGKIMNQFRRMGASMDYRRERFTMDEAYVRAVMTLLRPPLGPGLDLPRQPDRQLVPVAPDGALRPRARARGGRRRAHLRALPAGRRLGLDHDRHRPSGDDPRRRRRRGASGRRALPRISSGRRSSSRSSSAAYRSSPTSGWSPSSVRAR